MRKLVATLLKLKRWPLAMAFFIALATYPLAPDKGNDIQTILFAAKALIVGLLSIMAMYRHFGKSISLQYFETLPVTRWKIFASFIVVNSIATLPLAIEVAGWLAAKTPPLTTFMVALQISIFMDLVMFWGQIVQRTSSKKVMSTGKQTAFSLFMAGAVPILLYGVYKVISSLPVELWQ